MIPVQRSSNKTRKAINPERGERSEIRKHIVQSKLVSAFKADNGFKSEMEWLLLTSRCRSCVRAIRGVKLVALLKCTSKDWS